jgi:hypothetical protein
MRVGPSTLGHRRCVSPAGGHSSVHHQASMAAISPSLIVGMPVSVDIMG